MAMTNDETRLAEAEEDVMEVARRITNGHARKVDVDQQREIVAGELAIFIDKIGDIAASEIQAQRDKFRAAYQRLDQQLLSLQESISEATADAKSATMKFFAEMYAFQELSSHHAEELVERVDTKKKEMEAHPERLSYKERKRLQKERQEAA